MFGRVVLGSTVRNEYFQNISKDFSRKETNAAAVYLTGAETLSVSCCDLTAHSFVKMKEIHPQPHGRKPTLLLEIFTICGLSFLSVNPSPTPPPPLPNCLSPSRSEESSHPYILQGQVHTNTQTLDTAVEHRTTKTEPSAELCCHYFFIFILFIYTLFITALCTI